MNQLELLGDTAQKLARMYPGYAVTIYWTGIGYEVGILGRECSPEDYLIEPGPLELAALDHETQKSLTALELQDSEPAGTRTQNQRIKS